MTVLRLSACTVCTNDYDDDIMYFGINCFQCHHCHLYNTKGKGRRDYRPRESLRSLPHVNDGSVSHRLFSANPPGICMVILDLQVISSGKALVYKVHCDFRDP